MNPVRLASALAFARTIATLWILLPLVAISLPVWAWPITSWSKLYLIVGIFAACFWVGCWLAAMLFEATNSPPGPASPPWRAARTVTLVLLIAIVMNIATIFSRAAFNPFACANLLSCSNDAYQAYVAGQSTGEGAAFEYLRIAVSPLIYAALALAIWGKEGDHDRHRWLRWGVIGTEVVLAIATGTSRNIGNLLLFAFFVSGVRRRASGAVVKPRSTWFYIGVVALVLAFLSYFAFTQLNRDGFVAAVGLLPFGHGYIEALSYTTDDDSVVLKAVESVVRYLASGYFSLALALDLAEGKTFPFGSSMFLARRSAMGTGDDSYVTLSLPGQIESLYGWSYMQQWHSLFSWMLSDYGYIGTGIVMIGVGFFFIAALGVSLTVEGVWSKLAIFIGFIMVAYIPANNQIFQAPETYVAFLVAAALVFKGMLDRFARTVPVAAT